MASTRSKNTPGDYSLQQRQIDEVAKYYAYENSYAGEAANPKIAGDGLLMGRMVPNNFSFNPYQMRYMPPIHLPVTPYPNNNNQTRTLRTSSVRPPPKPNTTMLGKLISPA